MNPYPSPKPSRAASAWTRPALLGAGTIFALVAALVADGQPGWSWLCSLFLLTPPAVVCRALWRR